MNPSYMLAAVNYGAAGIVVAGPVGGAIAIAAIAGLAVVGVAYFGQKQR
jgi:hypothetical protein